MKLLLRFVVGSILLTAFVAQTHSATVEVTLRPGFNLISNPLIAVDNSIGALFKNLQGGVPGGTKVFKLVGGQFITAEWNDLDNVFMPESTAAETTLPGDGVFVYLTGSADKILTFTGEPNQGQVCTPIPRGVSIKSNVYPTMLDFGTARLPLGAGDVAYIFNRATGSYNSYIYNDL